MTDPVSWQALAFLAGVIIASVVWTTVFWRAVPLRSEMEKIEARLREIEKKKGL